MTFIDTFRDTILSASLTETHKMDKQHTSENHIFTKSYKNHTHGSSYPKFLYLDSQNKALVIGLWISQEVGLNSLEDA